MKIKDIYYQYTVLSPIFQSQPKPQGQASSGNKSEQRTMTFIKYSDDEAQEVSLPVVSGASRRAAARRDFVNEILRALGLMKGWEYSKDIKSDTLLALLIGGHLSRGEQPVANIEGYMSIYDKLPFFGLLGGNLESIFFPGRLSCGFAIPVTTTTYPLIAVNNPFDYTEAKNVEDSFVKGHFPGNIQGYVRFPVQGVVPSEGFERFLKTFEDEADMIIAINNDLSKADEQTDQIPPLPTFVEYLEKEENKDTLEKVLRYFSNVRKPPKNAKEVEREIKKLSSSQMLYHVSGAIPAGTYLHAHDYLQPGYGDDDLMEMCWHKYIETMLSRPQLGSMFAKGYGSVAIKALMKDGQPFSEVSRAKEFDEWLQDNRKQVIEDIKGIEEILFAK